MERLAFSVSSWNSLFVKKKHNENWAGTVSKAAKFITMN